MADYNENEVAYQTQRHETVLWSNFLVNAPVVYSLIEKRVLYYLTLEIKHRFVEKGLDSPSSWDDLHFHLTDKDLGVIGGNTHILQTYEALSDIGKKFLSIDFYNKNREIVKGKVHWIDSFFYNVTSKVYDVRVSPEIMPYLINLTKAFTAFNAHTALSLKSKYTQKFYELCCEYSGNYRYKRHNSNELAFKKNVYPMYIENARELFGVAERRDARTGKVLTKGKYTNYKDFRRFVIEPAQKELYELYHSGLSDVWFDCMPYKYEGRKITAIIIFIYTKENPKPGLSKIWVNGDAPLNPYEDFTGNTFLHKVEKNIGGSYPTQEIEILKGKIKQKLECYLEVNEVIYYINILNQPINANYDSYMQILQVIEEKEKQPKFKSGTMAYKRKSLMHYALQENLKEFGWSIPEPNICKKKNRHVETLKKYSTMQT